MRMDKLTSRFQQALADAQSLAVGRDHNLLEPVHVLTALLDQSGGSTRPLLAQAGVNVPLLRERLGEALEKLPKVSGQAGNLSVGNDLTRLLNLTDKLAQQNGDQFIASEWFVLAALEDGGAVGQALKAAGANKARLQAAIDKIRGGETVQSENAEDQRQALEKYTIDLTARAESGKLDPVIGRDEEIRRTIQVLQRRTKNNPVLIGEPGVGNHGLTGGGAADGLAQLLGFYIFQQVAACASAQGRAQVGRVFGHGQHQHHHLRHVLQDQLQRFDARYAGHVQVHQHHVGQQLGRQAHAVESVRCLAHHLE